VYFWGFKNICIAFIEIFWEYEQYRVRKRLKKENIFLPINKNGNPDYKFMENFIKKLEYQ